MDGTRTLRLSCVRYEAEGILSFELRDPQGGELPAFTAGAHIDLHLPGGMVRQYSLLNPPDERHRYVLGVKLDRASRGGSRHLHEQWRVGMRVQVGGPRNHFPLDEDAAHSVLIAGGIGITPIACMAQRLSALGRSWELHVAVRRAAELAFVDGLDAARVHVHVDEAHGGRPLDVAAIVASAPADAQLYACGPAPLLDAFEAAGRDRPGRCHLERFSAAAPAATGGGYTVRLAASGRDVPVPPGATILDSLREAGIDVRSACENGVCGTCETRVLQGVPEHRDSLLSDEERASNQVMMICCSGSRGDLLVLDL